MESTKIKSYAKVNITLDVTGVREDGYHLVKMVMQAVNLYDEILLRKLPSENRKITIKSSRPYVPTDERNTAYKAAALIMKECLREDDIFELRIDIKKNIPVAAGLAGGSSNAAGVIIGMNRMLDLGMDLQEMCSLGSRIGADVPFCIMAISAAEGTDPKASTAALAEGIGEILTPITPLRMWTVLVKPHFSVSTAAVYKALDQVEIPEHPDTERILKAMADGNIRNLRGGMVNVLENVTLKEHPDVAELRRTMQKYCSDMTVMSGSGPTVFSLFAGRRDAMKAYSALKNELGSRRYTVLAAAALQKGEKK